MNSIGCNFEVSSLGELKLVLEAGIQPSKILFTGPAKDDEVLSHIVSKNIGIVSVESEVELEILNAILKRSNKSIDVILRLNPKKCEDTYSIRMVGISSQFGIDCENINQDFFNRISNLNYINIKGFHIFGGSNISNEENLLRSFKNSLDTIFDLCQMHKLDIQIIDLGGGFPANFGTENSTLIDYINLKSELETYIMQKFDTNKTKFLFESGRFIVAECGALFGSVIQIKKSKGINYCILDFGINSIGGMSASGRALRNHLDVLQYDKKGSEGEKYNVVGPLCTPMDIISKNTTLFSLERGELLYIPNVGAYGLTASLIGFLSHKIPKEVIWKNDEIIDIINISITKEMGIVE